MGRSSMTFFGNNRKADCASVEDHDGARDFGDYEMALSSLFADSHSHEFSGDAMDELQSALIAGYEHALQNGLEPSHALASIIRWVADETARLNVQSGASNAV
jgi:hypothetical protein